jgi:glucose-1-phosphate adenylyltransferase
MSNAVIEAGTKIDKAVIAQDVKIGKNCEIGVGEFAPSTYDQRVYNADLVTVGENSVIPDNVKVGRNTAIYGVTTAEDYPDGLLASGGAIIKEDSEI